MAGIKKGDKYYCTRCGQEVQVTRVGAGYLVCCEIPMKKVGL
jgi:desulfoferrodoxin-like iron-binding protein